MNYKPNYKRRQILRWLGLATGGAILPAACSRSESNSSISPAASPLPLSGKPVSDRVSRVAVLQTDDRVAAIPKILDLLQPEGFSNKTVFLKPNYNTGDPAPAATDTDLSQCDEKTPIIPSG